MGSAYLWPNSRSTYLARISTSRFTKSPGSRERRLVCANVYGITATLKAVPQTPVTVRLMPFKISVSSVIINIANLSASKLKPLI
jgi:hypothetical protein